MTIANGAVLVGGTPLGEPYLVAGTRTESQVGIFNVPAGSYFLLFDNGQHGGDSRFPSLGFVPRAEIVGRIAR